MKMLFSVRDQERTLLKKLCFSLAKAVTHYVNALVRLKSFSLWSWDNVIVACLHPACIQIGLEFNSSLCVCSERQRWCAICISTTLPIFLHLFTLWSFSSKKVHCPLSVTIHESIVMHDAPLTPKSLAWKFALNTWIRCEICVGKCFALTWKSCSCGFLLVSNDK